MAERDPLSVALFTYSTQPRGGVAHALSLGEALQRAGHAVRVFAIDRSGARFSREPACAFTVLEIESRKESLFDFVRRRSDALVTALETSSQRFDVYHAHDGMSADALRRLAANGSIGSYVRTVHHLTGYDDPHVEAIDRDSIENARRLFVVSGMWRADLSTRYGRTASIVGNGIDRSRFFPANVAPVRDPARPHFLTIGGIEQRKNTIALIEAFALVKRRVPGARLTIAGGASVLDHGAYRHAFDLRVAELDLVVGTDVEIAQTVSDAEILTLLRAADAFVFPSVVEGFGLVVLEALACGLPVVVSEIAPFVEYLGADDAIFVSPRAPDSIARGMLAALDAATALRLRARGPNVAARHSWEAVADAYVRGYDA